MRSHPNGYTRKQKHKHELKRRHAVRARLYCAELDKEKCIREYEEDCNRVNWTDPRNRGYDYWKLFYLSGRRKYAKKSTNRCIRNRFRMSLSSMNPEELFLMHHADYQKEFDYWWTIW